LGWWWLAGDVGTLITDDGSGKPLKVEASNGTTWWYKREAISGTCDVAGCSRATWNGDFEGQCCRTCKSSGGAKHGPDCEAKAKGGAGGCVRLEGAGGDKSSLCNGMAAGCCVVTRDNYCSGRNVVRGPSWEWQDQDGGTCLTCQVISCCVCASAYLEVFLCVCVRVS
jgi:hypothetical protein